MTRVSSTTLFNFTDSIDFLIDNLKNGFYCHNTYEKLPIANNGYRIPMACFCDIPLSLIKEHFDWYGRYGIGIKRTYAREQGVKPVWYVTSENTFVKRLVGKEKIEPYVERHLLPYLKQFIGFQYYQKENRRRRKKFYDEREWRYVPPTATTELLVKVKKENIPDAIQNGDRMKLDLNQVEYIIIEKERDFDRILKELIPLCEERHIRYESLVSKVITARQIERDF